MNAKLSISDCLRVCMQLLHPVSGWIFPAYPGVLAVLLLVSAACAVSVHAEEYDIIIEKNLFHDQRQKWEMEKSQVEGDSSQAGPIDRQDLDQINLFGTVIKDSKSYAVMRVSPPAGKRKAPRRVSKKGGRAESDKQSANNSQDNKRPYAVGDFINGYQIVDIKTGLVLLQDPYDNNRYEIFMNDRQTERTVVRTEIPEDTPAKSPKAPRKGRSSSPKSRGNPEAPQSSAASADFMRQRFEKNLQRLNKDNNADVARQAERDWKKLQPLMSSLDEKEQEELKRLKSEFEALRQ